MHPVPAANAFGILAAVSRLPEENLMRPKSPEPLNYAPVLPPRPYDPATWPSLAVLLFSVFLAVFWALAAPTFTPGSALSFDHHALALIACLIIQALALRCFRQRATPRRVGLLVVILLCALIEANLTLVVINFCRGHHRGPLTDW